MEKPLISVIVPAYNIEAYVGKTIASIAAQTYRNLEIIIIDDGSSDSTGAVVDAMAQQDSRIRVIHKENGGVTSARLRGIAEAAGEWIGFVDGDDYIDPQMYERLLGNALKYNADISHCGYQMVFPKGHVDFYYNTGRLEQHDRQEGVMALLEGAYVEPGLWNKLFRRNLFCELLSQKFMDTSIRLNEDLLMNYYLFREAKRSVYEDFCPYSYLLRPSSAATSKVAEYKLEDPLKVIQILLKETKENPRANAIVRKRHVRMLVGNATLDCSLEENAMLRGFRQRMRKELRGMLKDILTDRDISFKLKAMALWAGMLPGTYRWVHRVYAKLKGTYKIYSLDK